MKTELTATMILQIRIDLATERMHSYGPNANALYRKATQGYIDDLQERLQGLRNAEAK